MGEAEKRKPLHLDGGNLTEKNMGQLKKLNLATFPVHYKDQSLGCKSLERFDVPLFGPKASRLML